MGPVFASTSRAKSNTCNQDTDPKKGQGAHIIYEGIYIIYSLIIYIIYIIYSLHRNIICTLLKVHLKGRASAMATVWYGIVILYVACYTD